MNEYIIENSFALIILRNKHSQEVGRAIIDLNDVELCKQYQWYLDSLGYARTTINGKKVRLHKLISNTDSSTIIDHINRNKLDCRKNNLRECSYSLNAINKGIQRNNTSLETGVSYHVTYKPTNSGYWYARYTNRELGIKLAKPFKEKSEAIKQRNQWVKKYGGRTDEQSYSFLNRMSAM